MFHISELHLASLLMDCAAFFLLLGTMVHTTVYRHRGRTEDRLFFASLVLTMIMGISDGMTYILDSSEFTHAYIVSYVFNDVFYFAFESVCALVCLFLVQRVWKNLTWKKGFLLFLPALGMNIMFVANHFLRFLFDVDPATNMYFSTELYPLIFIGPAFYGVLALILIIKIDKGVCWLYALLILLRVFLGHFMRDVSSTALVFAIGLVFAHIHVMDEPFYEEEKS